VSPDVDGRLRGLVSASSSNSISIRIGVHRNGFIALPFQSGGLVPMKCECSNAFIFLILWKDDELNRVGKSKVAVMIGELHFKI
jgi:hypothetical protein